MHSLHLKAHLRASKGGYEDLNARFKAADEERTKISQLMKAQRAEEEGSRMSALMTAKLLAEAESQELYARRLRESVARIGQDQACGGSDMLRLTTSPVSEEAIELDAATHVTSEMSVAPDASEDSNHPGVVSPQLKGASTEEEEQQAHETLEPASTANEQSSARLDSVDKTTQTQEAGPSKSTHWLPHAISQLAPLKIVSPNDETFTWEELYASLGGAQYSPGLYFTKNSSSSRVLQGRTYWLLEAQFEPFIPITPGQHGAKLTAFFNDTLTPDGTMVEEEDLANVPVFVCLRPGQKYTYLGQYSQKRYSDRLSHSEMFEYVPTKVLQYWASQLACPARPQWVTDALIAHFWPAPTYLGPSPSDSAVTTPRTGVSAPENADFVLEKRVQRAIEGYAGDLKDWKKEVTLKAGLLKEETLMQMWDKSDMDVEKGLRLWLEYLECVGFDEEFYANLVGRKTSGQQRVMITKSSAIHKVSGENQQDHAQEDSKRRHDSVMTAAPAPGSTSTIKVNTAIRSKKPINISLPPPPFPKAGIRSRGKNEKPREIKIKW
jgi:hypothetical protein